jgi:hypothetical protein
MCRCYEPEVWCSLCEKKTVLTVILIRFLGLSSDLLLVLLSESLARRAVLTLVISSAYLVSSERVVHDLFGYLYIPCLMRRTFDDSG